MATLTGSRYAAPARHFARLYLDASSPDMSRRECASHPKVDGASHSQPLQLFDPIGSKAEAWPADAPSTGRVFQLTISAVVRVVLAVDMVSLESPFVHVVVLWLLLVALLRVVTVACS